MRTVSIENLSKLRRSISCFKTIVFDSYPHTYPDMLLCSEALNTGENHPAEECRTTGLPTCVLN